MIKHCFDYGPKTVSKTQPGDHSNIHFFKCLSLFTERLESFILFSMGVFGGSCLQPQDFTSAVF